MPGLLFLHGGPEFSRRVLAEERRAYWSPSLPIVLEKNGYLAVDVRTEQALADPALLAQYDCAVISRLPDEIWDSDVIRALLGSGTPVLLEPPLPAELARALGIVTAERVPGPPGVVLNVRDPALMADTRAFGYGVGGRVAPNVSASGPPEGRVDWSTLGAVPLEPDLAAAWRAPGYDLERWALSPDVEVLAEWRNEQTGEQGPALVRAGEVMAASFSIAAFLARTHTAEPWYRGERRVSHRSTGVEHVLLAIVDQLHARANATRARVRPWPDGASWALNVRHDFDRPLRRAAVAQIAARHEELGSAPTWYWRSRHLRSGWRRMSLRRREREGNAAIREVARFPAQEIAHHTEMPWAGAEQEQHTIETVSGRRVRGACSHGDPTCFRFQGAPNVLWAERQGLLYTELIQQSHFHPHRFPSLGADGVVAPLDVICLPHHESFDRSVAPGDFAMERLSAAPGLWSQVGGMLQVMNHPDINIDPLFELLAGMPRDARVDWTAERCIDWWRRTHVRQELSLESRGRGRFALRSRSDVTGLVIELRAPSGSVTVRRVDLPAGVEVMVNS